MLDGCYGLSCVYECGSNNNNKKNKKKPNSSKIVSINKKILDEFLVDIMGYEHPERYSSGCCRFALVSLCCINKKKSNVISQSLLENNNNNAANIVLIKSKIQNKGKGKSKVKEKGKGKDKSKAKSNHKESSSEDSFGSALDLHSSFL